MVDGQQRARSIIAFWRGHFPDSTGVQLDAKGRDLKANAQVMKDFQAYPLNVTMISDLDPNEHVEGFYALVNSTGLRLNRPELRKAEYFQTNFLRLVTLLAGLPDFKELRLFTDSSASRMNDIDFVGELVALMKYGTSDKKEKVESLYEADVDESECEDLRRRFATALAHFCRFNKIVPLYRTRYSQKNDFYTLFGFVCDVPSLPHGTLDYFYRVLVKVDPFIRPSQDKCDPFMDYALNCVTQSNSKRARDARTNFLRSLLLNPERTPNNVQKAVLAFFGLGTDSLVRFSGYTTLNAERLKDPRNLELPLGGEC